LNDIPPYRRLASQIVTVPARRFHPTCAGRAARLRALTRTPEIPGGC